MLGPEAAIQQDCMPSWTVNRAVTETSKVPKPPKLAKRALLVADGRYLYQSDGIFDR